MKIQKFLLFLAISIVLFSCKDDGSTNHETSKDSVIEQEQIVQTVEEEIPSMDVVYEYVDYLIEYTAGIISVNDTISIRVNSSYESFLGLDNIDLKKAFTVKGVKGEYSVDGENVIQFTPNEPLSYDTLIDCQIDFSEIFRLEEGEEKVFDFNVRTKKLDYDLKLGDLLLTAGNKENNYNFTGVVEFSDSVEDRDVEKALTATIDDEKVDVLWSHQGNKHNFTIKNITRTKKSRELKIGFNGKVFRLSRNFSDTVDILPIGVFQFLKHRVDRGATKVVTINFTSPIMVKQNFNSLISVEGDNKPRITVSGSQLKIYPQKTRRGEVGIKISKNLLSEARQSLGKEINLKVVIEQEYPDLKMIGKSGIITGDKALFFPFEAISLRGVDIRIIEVFENNLIQYLQDNKLASTTTNFRRVAKPIYQGTVYFDEEKQNLLLWNRYHINLEDYIDVNPGSVYQVQLSFRRSLSLYGDADANANLVDRMTDEKWPYESVKPAKESSYWDYYDDYNYNSNWQSRNDPNSDAYYSNPERTKTRTVFATNIGLIAKRSDSGDLRVFATDINSTEYIKGAEITLYNFQQQEIARGSTDSYGSSILKVGNEIPFVVKIQHGDDVGYLRLDDGGSLNTSTFDTSGVKNPKGLKGFIYGERGVWRPGDKVYLHFILEDELYSIPAGHPIIMVIKNPKGATVERMVKSKSDSPIYPFIFETSEEDATGNWIAEVQVGDQSFRKLLMIESVKPNRLKIDLDFGVEELGVGSYETVGDLRVNWLHGAPGKNLKAEFKVSYSTAPTSFPNYSDFIFTDPSKKITSSSTEIFKGSVDENGYASVSFNLNKKINSPGKARVNFYGKAFEESGDFSIKNFSIPYSPYESYVGIRVPKGDASRDMLLTDVDHEIKIVTVDSNGNPISRPNLKATLYKIDWKWWWDQKAYSEIPNFVSKRGKTVETSGTLSTVNGEGIWTFQVNYPSWGRYYLRVEDSDSGHSTGRVVYIDWPGWAGRSTESNDGVSRLFFSTDKKEYNLGDDIEVTFPSSEGGKALVSLENGTDVIETFWIDTKDKLTGFKFKTKKSMFPGAYIHITMIQPRSSKNNDRPVRLYGILPVKVNDKESLLTPVITMDDVLKPNSDVNIMISEESGKAMYYTLSVVDEGLLDLTNFITPNPYKSFFQREALGVKTWDLYDAIIGDSIKDYGSLLAVGGGGSGDDTGKKEEVNRFAPVVKVFGPYKLEAGESKNHSFFMPNYVGSVRTMVTAASEKQYGASEKATAVKDPLMVLGTMPRVIGPKEKVTLPVTVFVMEDDISDVDVTVKTEGLIKIVDNAKKPLSFGGQGDDLLFFDLETLDDIGEAKVIIEATSGKHSSLYTVEIGVRPSNPYISKSVVQSIEEGKEVSFTLEPWGYPGSRSMTLELSSMPSINLDERLKYLIRYPHGCIEQTTSGVFPQLFLKNLKDLTDTQRSEVEKNINAGIERLKKFTTTSGGLAYWPGDNYPSSWGSTYAGHFLVEADRLGYPVPSKLLERWADYQKKQARSSNSNDLNQAYRLYTLALYGEPEMGAMNRLFDSDNLSTKAKWRLAAAYALTGNSEAAESLVMGLNYNISEYKATSNSFGSALRDKAMILETYALMNKDAYKLANHLSEKLGEKKSFSTQTTAYALLALSKYGGDGTGISAEVILDNQTIVVNTTKALYSEQIPYSKDIKVINISENSIFATILSEGVEIVGEESSVRAGLGLERNFILPSGSRVENLSSGTTFKQKVTVKNLTSQLQEEIALSVLIPGGWEINNKRVSGSNEKGESEYEYKDIRDDRVYYYFDLTAGETKTFFVELTASYSGHFYLPSITAESMYNLDVKAQVPGEWITVVSTN